MFAAAINHQTRNNNILATTSNQAVTAGNGDQRSDTATPDRMRANLNQGSSRLHTATHTQFGMAALTGLAVGVAARSMVDANSSIGIGLMAGSATALLPTVKPSPEIITTTPPQKSTERLSDAECNAGVLAKKDLGGVRDYMQSAGQVTKADLRRIKPISALDKNEGVLNGITIRVDQKNEEGKKTKTRLALTDAFVDELSTPNEHGETRHFVRTVNGAISDKFAEKSPNFCRQSHLLDSVTLMRADVTRAIQKIKGEGKITEAAVSGDNFHVDGLDLSAANIQPGDILQVGESLLFASHNPHYACSQFESRFGALAYDFINSEAEFLLQNFNYDTDAFADVAHLKDVENQTENNAQYPKLAKEKLGALHRLRGIRLAVLKTGRMSIGDSVKLFRHTPDGQYLFDNGKTKETLQGITPAQNAFISRLNDGALTADELAVRVVNDENVPHVNARENAESVHEKQVQNRERDQGRIAAGKRRNDPTEPWFNVDDQFQWQKLVGEYQVSKRQRT